MTHHFILSFLERWLAIAAFFFSALAFLRWFCFLVINSITWFLDDGYALAVRITGAIVLILFSMLSLAIAGIFFDLLNHALNMSWR